MKKIKILLDLTAFTHFTTIRIDTVIDPGVSLPVPGSKFSTLGTPIQIMPELPLDLSIQEMELFPDHSLHHSLQAS